MSLTMLQLRFSVWRMKNDNECMGVCMNEIQVSGVGWLKTQLGEGLTVAPGQTVGEAVGSLKLGTAKGLPLTPVVNNRVVEWGYILQPGDSVVLVPTLGGGN
jgi:molybdopterin converting factor small subunit